MARRSSGLDERDRVGCVLPEPRSGAGHVVELAEHVRGEHELGRAGRGREVSVHPACTRQGEGELAAGGHHLRLRLDERHVLERRPGGDRCPGCDAGPCADVEQRPRPPVRPLQRHLPEDRGCGRIRRRRAVGEVCRDLAASPRCTCRLLAAIGRRDPLDLRGDRDAGSPDQLLDRVCEVGRERAQDESTASTSSACVSGFTFRNSLATLPSASITNVERSTPMYVLPA